MAYKPNKKSTKKKPHTDQMQIRQSSAGEELKESI